MLCQDLRGQEARQVWQCCCKVLLAAPAACDVSLQHQQALVNICRQHLTVQLINIAQSLQAGTPTHTQSTGGMSYVVSLSTSALQTLLQKGIRSFAAQWRVEILLVVLW